jgi:uncharacterized protein
MLETPRTRRFLGQLLHTHDTPERTALAFAVGVFFGFSPFLGLHTVLGLVAAFVFSLNRVAVLLGIYSNLPWILPAYYTLTTMLGAALLRVDIPPGLMNDFRAALDGATLGEFRTLLKALTPMLWAYALGSTIGAVALAVAGYRASLTMIVAHRRRHPRPEPPKTGL